MPDWSRFLPLSQRSSDDESGVSSDWRAKIADVVDATAAAAAASRSPDVSAAVVAFLLASRTGGPEDALADTAAHVRTGPRRGIRDLARTVRAYLQAVDALGVPAHLDGTVWGAVSLYAATTTDHARRAVVHGHTVRATDAEWEFGRGPVLEGTAADIAAFLLGVSEIPPQPVSSRG